MKNFIAVLIAVFCSNAMAEEIVTFIEKDRLVGAPKGYLEGPNFWNEGYVSARVTMANPEDKPCIDESSSYGIKSYLIKKETEVIISARVWGFRGVSEDKWIPLVSYKWNNQKKLCRTMLRDSVLLVPLTPIVPAGSLAGPGLPDEPYIVIGVKVISKDEEQISAAASSLISIAGIYASGGAAATVAGLVDFSGGAATRYLSEQFNSSFKSGADQTFGFQLKWDEIRKGSTELPFDLVSTSRRGWDSVEETIKNLRDSTFEKKKTLMRFRLVFDTRRSVFFSDKEINAGNGFFLSPGNKKISADAVLNYPRNAQEVFGGNLASINQLLSTDSTSLSQRLRKPEFANECRNLIARVEGAGFNKLDAALVVDSALSSAMAGWNKMQYFFKPCLGNDDLAAAIVKVRGKNYLDTNNAMYDVEDSEQYAEFVQPYHRDFLLKVRDALLKTGVSREASIKLLFEQSTATLPDFSSLGLHESVAVPAFDEIYQSQKNYLQSPEALKAGCFLSFSDGVTGAPVIGMAVIGKNKVGEATPNLLLMKIDGVASKENNAAKEITGIWLVDLSMDFKKLEAITAFSKYREGGLCYSAKSPAISPAAMYAQLRSVWGSTPTGN